ncbi:helix-turn-helix transcriptional regulator [Olivibacter sp. SDN3]|uniref:helix-turn-helix domain-containing protein n=1 Tax=Olivibacter sp. SDN3 TaxID=2764720 RepID=UPI00165112D2|nr:XRE family transcriptional regulator [Olivibacter sp. SDN3]QNL50207.1 helix-turn-helix transcriptional regulator [Olivibacter sp. SDN3]
MRDDILIQIGNQIKERRKSERITVQELADRASVSKGLISQIENNRVIPSLVVLIDIIRSLDLDLNVFFKDIGINKTTKTILLKKKEEYSCFKEGEAIGFHYQRILTRNIRKSTVDIVLLELESNASKPMVETMALEYNYILSGEIAYRFEDESVRMSAGDSVLFDGRIPHTPKNMGSYKAVMLVVYFFEEDLG